MGPMLATFGCPGRRPSMPRPSAIPGPADCPWRRGRVGAASGRRWCPGPARHWRTAGRARRGKRRSPGACGNPRAGRAAGRHRRWVVPAWLLGLARVALWPWRHRRVRRLPGLARCARWRRAAHCGPPATARRVAPGGRRIRFPRPGGCRPAGDARRIRGGDAGHGRDRGDVHAGLPGRPGLKAWSVPAGRAFRPASKSNVLLSRGRRHAPYQAGGGQRAPLALSAGPASDCSGSPANRRISESPRGVMKSSRRQHRAPSFFSARCTACLPGAAPGSSTKA